MATIKFIDLVVHHALVVLDGTGKDGLPGRDLIEQLRPMLPHDLVSSVSNGFWGGLVSGLIRSRQAISAYNFLYHPRHFPFDEAAADLTPIQGTVFEAVRQTGPVRIGYGLVQQVREKMPDLLPADGKEALEEVELALNDLLWTGLVIKSGGLWKPTQTTAL